MRDRAIIAPRIIEAAKKGEALPATYALRQ
jgi:hypothetical protein